MDNNQFISDMNDLANRTNNFRKEKLGYTEQELIEANNSGRSPQSRKLYVVNNSTALLPDHAKYELDGNPTTLERLQQHGVMPNEMVRINKKVYMNGQLLNLTGSAWDTFGIPVLDGPTVSDGISKPVVIIDDGFKADDPELLKFESAAIVEL